MRSRTIASDVAIPVKPLLQRALLVALVTLCLVMLFAGRNQNAMVQSARATLMDGVMPVMHALSKPVTAFNELTAQINDYFTVYADNERLRLENQRLLEWQSTALKLVAENEGLRSLLHYQPQQGRSYVTAKVVGHTANSMSQRLMINAGTAQGVQVHHAVMTKEGLIGRVITAGKHSAEIMLITDMNSRIPVITEPTGVRSILAGNRSELPHLAFVSLRTKPQLGDLVVTSADGDLFPAGLPVGKLFAEDDGQWQVRPFVDLATVRYVQVIATGTANPLPTTNP